MRKRLLGRGRDRNLEVKPPLSEMLDFSRQEWTLRNLPEGQSGWTDRSKWPLIRRVNSGRRQEA